MTDTGVRLGLLLPTRGIFLKDGRQADTGSILRLAEAAEEHGLDSLWVGDSLTAKPRLEPLSVLAAVAARTRRVRLGTAVLLGAMRHPLLLAQTVATLDHLSAGRITLALGVGGVFTESQRNEWTAAGVPPSQRAGRLEEIVTLLGRLWTERRVTFHGRFFILEDVALEPKPVQQPRPPLWLACHHGPNREAQYRRAARLADGYISITDSPEEFAEVGRSVREQVRETGRDPAAFDAAFYMTVNINTDEAKARDQAKTFIMRYYGQDYWGDRWGPYGSAEHIAQRIQEYARVGARTVILRFASFDQEAQLKALVHDVLPALQTAAQRVAGASAPRHPDAS